MQQEASFDFPFLQVVDELLVFFGTERRRYECLSFTARKERRAVNPWQPANFGRDRTYLGKPSSIRTPAFIQYVVAENSFFEIIEDQFGHGAPLGLIVRIRLGNFLLQRIDCCVTGALL